MEYFKILTEVEKIAKNKNRKPLLAPPKCGQIVLSEFGGKLNRAIALGVNEENDVKINYMDYGNVDIKSFKELYEAPECLSKMPRQAQPVMLKNVPSCYMNDKIRSYMYNCLHRNLIIKYSENDFNKDKNVYQVELFDEELKTNINEHIVKLSKISVPDNDYEFYEINDLKRVELPTGFNVQLVVMDNSVLNVGCITCTTKDFLVEIQKIQDDIQVFVENNPPSKYAPRVNELCIAQYDGDKLWYRGRCCETVGDGFPAIEFFDFGNIGYVNVNNIRRLPKEFLFPIYTHACELEGLPIDDIDEKLVSRLEELIPSCSIIKCAHVKYSDSLYTITLNKITEKLQAEGLLKNDTN